MAETQEPQTTEADKAEAERIVSITKKGFDLKARLEGRGLRRATITLYLDEELGAELGRAEEIKNNLGMVTGLDQVGILGDLDKFSRARAAAIKQYDDAVEKTPDMPEADRTRAKEALDGIVAGFDEKIAELEEDLTYAQRRGDGFRAELGAAYCELAETTDLMTAVGDRMAAKVDAQTAKEWAAAKDGRALRGPDGRWLKADA